MTKYEIRTMSLMRMRRPVWLTRPNSAIEPTAKHPMSKPSSWASW